MVQYRTILELYFKGVSQRTISCSVGSSRNTVSSIITKAKELGLTDLCDEANNQWLEEFLFPEKQAIEKGYLPPNWEYVHKELQKKNVTLKLLHEEYEIKARNSGKIPYAYRSFTRKYGEYAKKYKATMPIRRKPGELLEVDWAGSTLSITERATGKVLTVYLFVASFPYSHYSYVEGFFDMKSESWLTGHINAFEYFQAVPEALVPDNLKTGVTKPSCSEPILNEAYRELADYYGTVIIPARVKRPKDKPSVESTVGFVSRQIVAALRSFQCFNLNDLNEEIWKRLDKINKEPFQKRPGSRESAFLEEEKLHLQPLRNTRFKLSQWKVAKIGLNYHLQVDKMYYSVPYEYIRSEVDVRITKDLIEVYFKDHRIASHKRLKGELGQYSTLVDHMPENHRLFFEHTPENSRKWAESVGPRMLELVEFFLIKSPEKRALNQIMSLKSLARKNSPQDLEKTANSLLLASSNPTVSLFKTILSRKKKQGKPVAKNKGTSLENRENYNFIRGKDYFKGEDR